MNKEIMQKAGFKKELDLVEDGRCPFCAQVVKKEEFRDCVSLKEFGISGLCQKCQDNTFAQKGE